MKIEVLWVKQERRGGGGAAVASGLRSKGSGFRSRAYDL